jgi:NAD(P)H-dependent FMN reductase
LASRAIATKEEEDMSKKNVLAISGSLRKPSFTEKMLGLCLEGMGSEVEVQKFYPHKMKIGPCLGCWKCWGKETPGQCVQKDDFQVILDSYKQADYLLFAAPLYIFTFPATVKNILDRLFVLLKPEQVASPRGGTEHPKRFDRRPKAALISSCGFPEIENFDLLRPYFRKVCDEFGWRWSGEILISAAGIANAPRLFDHKYELIRKAGAELFADQIRRETTDGIAEPVMSAEDYRAMATASFRGGIAGRMKTVSIAMKAIYGMNTKA